MSIVKDYYKEYTGKEAPKDIERLEAKARAAFNKEYTSYVDDVAVVGNGLLINVKRALIEQIEYMQANKEALDYSATKSYSAGKYSKQGINAKDIKEIPKISPDAYDLLAEVGMVSTVGYNSRIINS